ncbi:DUF1772 domain-containing protein [Pseudonocardia sp. S2-4]|uniref:DUF1772 domain-containing protein n=1 Tax=Pseudonocardia humida TaxID=2800819 RepID=A0ABT1A7I3_9PSEU|nr:DUF1772 domain-containing protein [Pseudonocardia humida]
MTAVLLTVLTAAATISFGGILAETAMLYPNIFRDPPASLVQAREFMVAGSPSDFFPPLGLSVIATAAASVLLTWRVPRVRWLLVVALAVYVCCEFLFSAWFFWPRNEIMFVDPVGTHSDEYLRAVAAEFNAAHWVRVIGGGVTAALAATGALTWYRRSVEARADRAAAAGAA